MALARACREDSVSHLPVHVVVQIQKNVQTMGSDLSRSPHIPPNSSPFPPPLRSQRGVLQTQALGEAGVFDFFQASSS